MEKIGIGQPVRRREDVRLMTGKTEYANDLNLPEQYYAYFLRSPYPHAEIQSIDTSEAEAAPGVKGVFTSEHVQADRMGPMPCIFPVEGTDGEPMFAPPRYLLAVDRVRYVGEPVAMVVAETYPQALEAADLIQVDYNDLPFNVDPGLAMEADTPEIWAGRGKNLCVHYEAGDAEGVVAAFETAYTKVELDLVNNRVVPNIMEPRSCLAEYNSEKDLYTLYGPSQGVAMQKLVLANFIFQEAEEHFRVVSKDTGGGFGTRAQLYPESSLSLWASKKLGRPVKWSGLRTESFLTDMHGRDHLHHGELALDADGRLLGLRVRVISNMGAYLGALAPIISIAVTGKILGCAYNIPAVHLAVDCVFTNTASVDAYRGAGRPEAAYVLERLMEAASSKMGIASDEIRRRNFIKPEEFPYTNYNNLVITSGDFSTTQQMALERADWNSFEERRQQSSGEGKLRGIGMAYYLESSGGRPEEEAQIQFKPDGTVRLIVGTYSHGQGHETVFCQIVAEQLGVSFEAIEFIQGDSDLVLFGGGTGGSRSSQMGGVAVLRACQAAIDKGRQLAAHLMQSNPEDIEFEDGIFKTQKKQGDSVGNTVTLQEVAQAALNPENIPDGMETGLDQIYRYNRGDTNATPNGCHVCEVEVDPETGIVEVVRYTSVDDCGTVLNPLLAAGQVHGGVAQGLGQALLEDAVYDKDSGQLLTGSFLDYGMPKAHHIPPLNPEFNEVPQSNNDLGVKGIGETGTCGAPPAIVHAVLDALKDHGVTHLDMPLTAERVWRAIHHP